MFKPANSRPGKLGNTTKRLREDRVPMAKSATLSLDGAELKVPCTVRDLSNRGARVSVSNIAGIPDEFVLTVRSEDLVARARVEWRNHVEIGMLFLRKGQLFDEQKFQKVQSETYQKQQAQLQEVARKEKQVEAEKRAVVERQNQKAINERIRIIKIMGLDHRRPFSPADLKRAYRQQAMAKHPDHGGTMDAFMELNNAYRTLASSLNASNKTSNTIAL